MLAVDCRFSSGVLFYLLSSYGFRQRHTFRQQDFTAKREVLNSARFRASRHHVGRPGPQGHAVLSRGADE